MSSKVYSPIDGKLTSEVVMRYEQIECRPATRQTLLDLTSELTERMNLVVGLFIARHGLWNAALDMCLDGDQHTVFRISWALEAAYCLDKDAFGSHVDRFFDIYITSQNSSLQRVFTKMLCDLMRRGVFVPSSQQEEQIASKSFDMLLDPTTKVAIKVWCIELLCDLRQRHRWIDENLEEVIRAFSLEEECAPAMSAKARHALARLKRERDTAARTSDKKCKKEK